MRNGELKKRQYAHHPEVCEACQHTLGQYPPSTSVKAGSG
jgi:hypothetical protein